MGLFSKITEATENMGVGSNSTFSLMGELTSFDENTGQGIVSWAGNTYQINANPHGKYGLYEMFPFGVPSVGDSVLFNIDSTKKNAIQVAPADKRRRWLNHLEILKEGIDTGMPKQNIGERKENTSSSIFTNIEKAFKSILINKQEEKENPPLIIPTKTPTVKATVFLNRAEAEIRNKEYNDAKWHLEHAKEYRLSIGESKRLSKLERQLEALKTDPMTWLESAKKDVKLVEYNDEKGSIQFAQAFIKSAKDNIQHAQSLSNGDENVEQTALTLLKKIELIEKKWKTTKTKKKVKEVLSKVFISTILWIIIMLVTRNVFTTITTIILMACLMVSFTVLTISEIDLLGILMFTALFIVPECVLYFICNGFNNLYITNIVALIVAILHLSFCCLLLVDNIKQSKGTQDRII